MFSHASVRSHGGGGGLSLLYSIILPTTGPISFPGGYPDDWSHVDPGRVPQSQAGVPWDTNIFIADPVLKYNNKKISNFVKFEMFSHFCT